MEVSVSWFSSEYLFVGVDLGDNRFQVCIVSPTGAGSEERSFTHDGDGIGEAIVWLKAAAVERASRIAIAIESPRGAVVAGFLEAGFEVFSINPKQLDRFRDRFTVAGSKDDRLDARVLGDSLRTDPRAFRRLNADPGWLVRMRQASRMEDELKQECRRSANRLRAVLHEYHVELLALLPAADEPWFWDLVAVASTPNLGAQLRPKQAAKLLAEHRIRRITAQDVIERLRRRPAPAMPGVVEAGSTHARMLVPRLHLLTQQLTQCQTQIQTLLDELGAEDPPEQTSEHRDALILRSLPGAGRYVVATMLTEAYWALQQRDYRFLRALCGVAPVTEQSGRSRFVHMRRTCNHRLRNAVHHWAWNATLVDPHFARLYKDMRSHGLTHARALRGVADRLLNVTVAVLKNATLYDASLRRAAA
jgi:transposase